MSALAVVLALVCTAEPKTIAIAYFENDSADRSLDVLRKGLADMLISDLAGVSSVRVVEREKLQVLTEELKLEHVDPRSAVKLGRILAAHFILTGGYQLAGGKMRIDARLIEVATGAVASTTRVEAAQEDFFGLEKDLVDALVKTLKLPLSLTERDRLRSSQTESFIAFEQFSRGLDAMDLRQPDRARELFEAALAADPDFQRARDVYERVGALTKGALAHQDSVFDQQLKAMKVSDPQLDSKLFAMVNDCSLNIDQARIENLAALLEFVFRHQLKPKLGSRDLASGPFYFEALNLIMLTDKYAGDPEIEPRRAGIRAYLRGKYPQSKPVIQWVESPQVFIAASAAQQEQYVAARAAVLRLTKAIVP